MAEPTRASIGERIRQLRLERTPQMTQQRLADVAGVSVDLVRKLEQGIKQTALIGSLHRIAAALDVDVAELLARPARVDLANGDDDQHDAYGIVAIRRALTAMDLGDVEPAGLDRLRRQAEWSLIAFGRGQFEELARALPAFVAAARVAASDSPGTETFAVLSDAYHVTASMLTLLGHGDLAYLSMERALAAAERAEDPLRQAAFAGRMSWLLVHQTGGADQARRVAVAAADQAEPRMGKATAAQLAVWNSLLVAGAIAAARDDRAAEADDLLNLATAAATRLEGAGPVGDLYGAWYGMGYTVMQVADVCVVTGRPGKALEAAKRMPPDAQLLLIGRARHAADVAAAQTALGRDAKAVATLVGLERMAPGWVRHQPYPRTIVAELLERERRVRTPELRGLARRLGLAG